MQVVNNKSKLPSLRKKSPRVSFFLMNLLITTTLFLLSLSWPKESQAMTCPPLLSQQFLRLQDEAPQNLCQYNGKVFWSSIQQAIVDLQANTMTLKRFLQNTKIKVLLFWVFLQTTLANKNPVTTKKLLSFVTIPTALNFQCLQKQRYQVQMPIRYLRA